MIDVISNELISLQSKIHGLTLEKYKIIFKEYI